MCGRHESALRDASNYPLPFLSGLLFEESLPLLPLEWDAPAIDEYQPAGPYDHLLLAFAQGEVNETPSAASQGHSSQLPPPLPRIIPIELPLSIHSILTYGYLSASMTEAWDVRTAVSNFFPDTQWEVELGSEEATIPPIRSCTIHVDAETLESEGWTIEVSSMGLKPITVRDVLEAVRAQCLAAMKCRPVGGGGGLTAQDGSSVDYSTTWTTTWKWGGLSRVAQEEEYFTLKLF